MRNAAFLAVGVLLLLVQANLCQLGPVLEVVLPQGLGRLPYGWTPSLVLPLVIYLGVHEPSMPRGASLAFVLGYALDVLASAPIGLFTFVYVSIWWLARLAGVRLTAQTLLPRMSLAFVFAIVESAIVLTLLAVFGNDTRRPVEISAVTVPHAISTALFGPIVFRLAQKLQQGTLPARPAAAGEAGSS